MQNWHWKCIATWLALLNNFNKKFNFVFNDIFIENFYHQNFCEKSKNIKAGF
jgi:hypothetical protein